MRHGLFKRVIAMTICVSSFTGLLTGCGENPDEYIDNFTSEMQARIQANQAEVDKLQLAGLLSQESAESLKKSIANQESTVTTMSSVGDLGQYTYRIKSDGTLAGLGVQALRKDALSIVSDDDKAMEELMNNLDYNVYVLKKQDGDMNTLETLDIIAREVERAKNGEPTNIDHYFVDSGRKVWDFSDPDNKIVRPTLENPAFSETATEGSNVLGLNYVGVKVHVLENGEKESVDAIEVTMYEFNPSAISRLIGADGVNKDVYVIYNNNCYLMQYPVYYVSGWKKEGNDYEAVYKKSDLQINLLTNKVLDSYGNECFNEMGNIYNVSGDGKYNELGQASFVVDGVTGEATTFGYDEKDDGSDTYKPLNSDNYGRVVLRDYLELNYMPGVVDNETMVALGRRVRLTKFAGTGKEDIGLFIDKQGNEVENSLRIKITDIMDVNSGQGDNEGKRLKLDLQYSNQAASTGDTSTSTSTGTSTDTSTGTSTDTSTDTDTSEEDTSSVLDIGASQESLLETEYVDKIECSTRFPGGLVATDDDLKLGKLESVDGDTQEATDNTSNSSGSTQADNTTTEGKISGQVSMSINAEAGKSLLDDAVDAEIAELEKKIKDIETIIGNIITDTAMSEDERMSALMKHKKELADAQKRLDELRGGTQSGSSTSELPSEYQNKSVDELKGIVIDLEDKLLNKRIELNKVDKDTSLSDADKQSKKDSLNTEIQKYESDIKAIKEYIASQDPDYDAGDSSNDTTTDNTGGTTTGSNQGTISDSSGVSRVKHFMYGMAIDIDPFQSNLYSGWIMITDSEAEAGSLDWWNSWLKSGTYNYFVDRDKVLNFLTGSYLYEMRENGLITLDLDTIQKIQAQYNAEDRIAGSSFITTIFTILGLIVIGYSTLTLAAWVYDTNIIAGPRLMGVMTFGRWEAISSSDDLPYIDSSGKHYMTFSKTLKACIILIIVGVLIIFVDIMSVVDLIVIIFGKLAEVFGSIIDASIQ